MSIHLSQCKDIIPVMVIIVIFKDNDVRGCYYCWFAIRNEDNIIMYKNNDDR